MMTPLPPAPVELIGAGDLDMGVVAKMDRAEWPRPLTVTVLPASMVTLTPVAKDPSIAAPYLLHRW